MRRRRIDAGTPVYPIGGGTSLDYGTAADAAGHRLVARRARTGSIDYPARDMTITVEAGVTMADAGRRRWPPSGSGCRSTCRTPTQATLGGVVATAWSGPRRYGYGTMRDYVIGISAVDGRGTPFKGGGRVVKNVAGYDFCKLLTGSLGTLGVITQVTLKVKPLPRALGVPGLRPARSGARPSGCWRRWSTRPRRPSAIELLAGPALARRRGAGPAARPARWRGWSSAWKAPRPKSTGWSSNWPTSGASLGVTTPRARSTAMRRPRLWQRAGRVSRGGRCAAGRQGQRARPAARSSSSQLVQSIDPQASIQAHAGNGIVIARFAEFDAGDVSRAADRPVAAGRAIAAGGHRGRAFAARSAD